MKKQINGEKLRTLEAVSNSIAMRGCVFIENMERGQYGDTTPVNMGVNWSACGTKDTKYAIDFATTVAHAVLVCDYINARHLEAVYTGEPIFASKEEYDAACYQLADWLEECNADAIIEWLEA